jgi:hypothetical protein
MKSIKITIKRIIEAVDTSEVYLLRGENKRVDLLRLREI